MDFSTTKNFKSCHDDPLGNTSTSYDDHRIDQNNDPTADEYMSKIREPFLHERSVRWSLEKLVAEFLYSTSHVIFQTDMNSIFSSCYSFRLYQSEILNVNFVRDMGFSCGHPNHTKSEAYQIN